MADIIVHLNENEAKAFRAFMEAGALNIKNGSIEIHFDSEGRPVKAITHQHLQLSTPLVKGIVKLMV